MMSVYYVCFDKSFQMGKIVKYRGWRPFAQSRVGPTEKMIRKIRIVIVCTLLFLKIVPLYRCARYMLFVSPVS